MAASLEEITKLGMAALVGVQYELKWKNGAAINAGKEKGESEGKAVQVLATILKESPLYADGSLRIVSKDDESEPGKKVRYTAIVEAISGLKSKSEQGKERYATMLGIYMNDEADAKEGPRYDDYAASFILEHKTAKLLYAQKGKGAFARMLGQVDFEQKGIMTITHPKEAQIAASQKKEIADSAAVYLNADVSDYLKGIAIMKIGDKLKYTSLGNSAAHFADVASGAADAAIESTYKNNRHIAAGYGLIKEAGGFVTDKEGNSIGPQRYEKFLQFYLNPIVVAGTQEMANALSKLILELPIQKPVLTGAEKQGTARL